MTTVTHEKALHGLRVLELQALGPVPWACMLLADWGADVVRVENPTASGITAPKDTYGAVLRGRTRVQLDLKTDAGRDQFLALARTADVVVEGMRPQVMERLGLGPEAVFEVNPHAIYARMTGWGQHGPLASEAGHDINYIAVAGILHAIGAGGKPAIPLNLIGDFAGGACFLLMGVLTALVRPRLQRHHVVIDAAMVDGASMLMSLIHSRLNMGQWQDQRVSNPLDGGVPWYDTYATSDGKHVAVGALEPKFYATLLSRMGLSELPSRDDPHHWPDIRKALEAAFLTRSRDEWAQWFAGCDACVSPVLSMTEAVAAPHLVSRQTFASFDGQPMPAPAPLINGARTSFAEPSSSAPATQVIARWQRTSSSELQQPIGDDQ